ncbi:MAG: alpha-ketoacid dehydrogenase subunit beta [Lachnospiraceae bacterium]|nr:alpha-ketoacid dehydrogenase subunit beta [Lachnospiraceae bacterium]
MSLVKGKQAVNQALREELRKDPTVYCVGEDIGVYHRGNGLCGTSTGLLKEFGPERIMETPISEGEILGSSIGAAVFGLRPVAEIMHSEFLATCAEHLVYGGAKMATNSNGIKVPMVVRTPCGGTLPNQAIQNENCEAWFCNTPGLKVVMPSCPYDAKGLLKSAIRDDYPVLFMEHHGMYQMEQDIPEEEYLLPLGRADVKREGTDLTIVGYGFVVNRALEAAERLKNRYDIEVLDLRTLVPYDREAVLASVRKTGRAIVLYEARRNGGYGAEIAAEIAEYAFDYLKSPVVRLAGPNVAVNHPRTTEDVVNTVIRIMGGE